MPATVISSYDSAWPVVAQAWLERIETSLAGLAGGSTFIYDHIGSTAVPGLAAKPIIDIQVRTNPLPLATELEGSLGRLGLSISHGSRLDSPGVYFDVPRPGTDPDPDKHRKHLLFHPENESDLAVIVHVRRADSPFAQYVVTFRDWLRANPDEARRYALTKRSLATRHVSETDYDDYTRAKTDFLNDAQDRMNYWSRSSPTRTV
jgi:GrpB-like predicted nucleotidyltransferase (UPF0157 family)